MSLTSRSSHTLFAFHKLFALIVACNYFAFRVELFSDEYEQNHPHAGDTTSSFSSPSLTWESFDKDNAPKAFTFSAEIHIRVLGITFVLPPHVNPPLFSSQLIHDKSPPLFTEHFS